MANKQKEAKNSETEFFLLLNKNEVLGEIEKKDLYFFAECSRLVYSAEEVIVANLKKIGFTSVKFFDIDGAQVMCGANKNTAVIAFRGTQPTQMSDVWADLNFLPTKQRDGEGIVHLGFRNEVLKLEENIMKWVAKHAEKTVYCCGHSLGGAMATLFTGRHEDIVNKVFTYGSPRVGSGKFVKMLVTPHLRVVNNNDIVPSVPPALFGFRHDGEKRYLNFEGALVDNFTVAQDWKDYLKGIWTAIKKGEWFDAVRDHSMEKYCGYLREEYKKCIG